jgi:hypothetical protein
MNEAHRRAERLATEAKSAAASGDRGLAHRLFSEAADAELGALSELPLEQKRTRSVIAVSAASLLYKAQRYDAAEMAIFRMLGAQDLNDWASSELRVLLDVVADEKILHTQLGRKYSGARLTFSLRGGEIGSGTGPLDLILQKATGVRSLIYRFAEWLGQYPLRIRGAPPSELQQLIQARATEAVVGSFRMEIRLTEPAQEDLFAPAPVKAEAVGDAVFEFFERLNAGTREDLEEFVPDPGYRKALLELSKAVAPSGRRLKEIGLYRSAAAGVQSIYLTNALAPKIKGFIPRPPTEQGERRERYEGILRALHLDENWLEITLDSGTHVKCDTLPDMLDDLVGPMVNNRVVVEGPVKKRRGGVHRLLVEDIEATDE